MKKIIVILLSFLFITTCFFTIASGGGIKIWPGKIDIEINKWYDDRTKVVYPTISVTNPENYDIKVSVRIDNPALELIEDGYSHIPDLSWIKAVPDEFVVPAKSTEVIEIIIELPESEQSMNYNETWETWVVISSPIESGGGFNFNTNLAVKLFIKTPEGKAAGIQPIHILLFFFISLVIVYLAYSSFKKKKSDNAVFYFKNKKRGGPKF